MPFKILRVPSSTGKYELKVLRGNEVAPAGAEELAGGITSFVLRGPCNVPTSANSSVYTLTEVSPPAQNAGATEELYGTEQAPGTSSSSTSY